MNDQRNARTAEAPLPAAGGQTVMPSREMVVHEPVRHLPRAFEPLFPAETEGRLGPLTSRDLMSALFRRMWVILSCFLIVTGLVVAGLRSLPPTYVAEAKILIRTEQQGTPSFFSGIAAYREGRDIDPSNRRLETEMELLDSRPLFERVVRALDLKYDDVYHPAYAHLLRPLADWWDGMSARYLGTPPRTDKRSFADTVDSLKQSVSIQPLRSKSAETNSNLIKVLLRAPTPEVAQRALDAFTNEYVVYAAGFNQQGGEKALEIIERSLGEANLALQAAQARLKAFLGERGVVLSRSLVAVPPLAVPDPGEIAPPRGTAGGRLAARATDSPLQGSTAGDEARIAVLKARLTQLEIELAERRLVFTDQSERVQTLRKTIGDLRVRIQRESERNAENETTLIALQRDLRAAEDVYLDLRRRREQIVLFLDMNPTQRDTRVVVEPPIEPRDSEWRKSVLVGVVGSMAGLLLGLFVAGFLEYSDPTLRNPADVKRWLALDTLATIPVLRPAEIRATLDPKRVAET